MAKYIATQGGKGMVYIYDPVNDDFGPQRFPDVGYLDVLARLIDGDGFTPAENSALAPFWYLTKQALRVGEIPHGKTVAGMIDEINTKIGTLPSGNFPIFSGYETLFSWLNQPYTYPTSLAELITALYGNSETGARGLLEDIIAGFLFDTDGDGSPNELIGLIPTHQIAAITNNLAKANTTKIGTVPDGKNLAGMISETDAKIGTLPDGYDSVGAALTAMKSDIDAKSLPSSFADGQYVLSAKKVGETISYTWVKMDLTNEEQSQ